MKKIVYLIFFLFSLHTISFCSENEIQTDNSSTWTDTLKVATYNIRIKTGNDKGSLAWANRKKYVGELIKNHNFDVLGVQEVLDISQERDLSSQLPAHSHFSAGRDNTEGTEGERLAIFYKKSRFTALDQGYFFISPTPDVASIGWDAALNRMCLWMKLLDTHTQKSFYYFNVHLDHVGKLARSEGVKLVIAKIREIAKEADVILGGDFNASPADSSVYAAATTYLNDSRTISQTPPTGSAGTFNGWDLTSSTFPESRRIDFLFCRNIDVISYAVLNDQYLKTAYPSDHFPVCTLCVMK